MKISRRAFTFLLAGMASCGRRAAKAPPDQASGSSVVVYTALDQEFSEPLFAPFEQASGITVKPQFDTEATKTVGLANSIRVEAESGRVRCDLFWNNEILNTLRLRSEGLLRPMQLQNAQNYPEQYRAEDHTWFGFAARARVLIVNNSLVPASETPKSLFELADQTWRGRVGMAKPLFGTTATHAACLFAKLGSAVAQQFFLDLKRNGVQILSGNKQVAVSVGNGSLAIGLTDTDDAIGELEKGNPVRLVYLDREPGQLGTLFIPNTLAAIDKSPNPSGAERLADYLLSSEVEAALARGPSAQIPLNPGVNVESRVETPVTVHAMDVDWNAAAEQWMSTAKFMEQHFAGPS